MVYLKVSFICLTPFVVPLSSFRINLDYTYNDINSRWWRTALMILGLNRIRWRMRTIWWMRLVRFNTVGYQSDATSVSELMQISLLVFPARSIKLQLCLRIRGPHDSDLGDGDWGHIVSDRVVPKYSKILENTMQSKNASSSVTASPNGFNNNTNTTTNNNGHVIMASLLGEINTKPSPPANYNKPNSKNN